MGVLQGQPARDEIIDTLGEKGAELFVRVAVDLRPGAQWEAHEAAHARPSVTRVHRPSLWQSR